jgi:glycosyltransferase involved in cell wall biosynthesis
MPKLLSSLDVLVSMSGGSVMFEAMAMGKPVLSIRNDGRHSQHTQHGHNAWCIDGTDVNLAAAELAGLLHNVALRRRLGHAGREWVEHNLSTTAMVRKTAALYHNLVRPVVSDRSPMKIWS